METAVHAITVSSKGQVVLPKRLRDALRIRPGSKLAVRLEGTSLILEAGAGGDGWKPLNPAGTRLSSRELCRPVDLTLGDDRHSR
ncbi:MAG: AbrB/MazE/SpoVT family DNA-binding domain-containing protein [Gammaproteobacteria bacterium]|nr:AbrB/MazE/SpoVT family DNA-binding domain-containing protein [Gammaproteobacteria bacterium]